MDKVDEYNLKDDILSGELEPEVEESISQYINVQNIFSEDYIQYLIDKRQNGGIICVRPDFVKRFALVKMFDKDTIETKDLDFLQFIIELGAYDIPELTENIGDESKLQIYSRVFSMFEEDKLHIDKLISFVDDKVLREYYNQHKDNFSSYEVVKLYEEAKMDTISNKEINIIFNEGSFDLLCRVVDRFQLDKAIIDNRAKIEKEKAIISEKTSKLIGFESRIKLSNDGKLKLSEEEEQILIENGSATKFYDLWNKGAIDECVYQRRNNLDKDILDNASEYDENTVMEAFSGLYFHSGPANFKYDLEMIIEYYESESEYEVENIDLIRKLHSFISKEFFCDRPEQFKALIDEMQSQCVNFKYDEFENMMESAKEFFNSQLNLRLKDTMKTMMSNIEPEQIEGSSVKLYKIANQTEAQRKILMLIHAEGVDDAEKYYERDARSMCFSVQDNNHLIGFLRNAINFGYCGIDKNKMISAYTCDGQTNQKHDILDGTGKGIMPSALYSIEDYMENTYSYNEVLYKMEGKKIPPNYIKTHYEKPSNDEIRIAEKFNIPILYVEKEQYQDKQIKSTNTYKSKKIYDTEVYRDIKQRAKIPIKEYKNAILSHMQDIEKLEKVESSITLPSRVNQNYELQ